MFSVQTRATTCRISSLTVLTFLTGSEEIKLLGIVLCFARHNWPLPVLALTHADVRSDGTGRGDRAPRSPLHGSIIIVPAWVVTTAWSLGPMVTLVGVGIALAKQLSHHCFVGVVFLLCLLRVRVPR